MNRKIGGFLVFVLILNSAFSQKTSLIIDADTGNEMDDLYAITRALVDPKVEVIGVVSAHFNNPMLVTDSMWHTFKTKGINTVKISQQLNAQLLKSLGKEEIPHPQGAEKMIGYTWGYYQGAQVPTSEGIDFIISEAKKRSPENKLNICILGPATNVAAAIETAPEIIPNIKVYMLGTRYNAVTAVWNKNSFNARNDLNALDVLFNTKNLDLTMLPISFVDNFKFDRDETLQKLKAKKNTNAQILAQLWTDVAENRGKWIMWDLALIEAVVNPNMARLEKRTTPPENTQRTIGVYTKIDEKAMEDKFWELYTAYTDFR
ncbi:nucleoside hydrolase [Galbibacter mesophilus]|uniref:nucleoside hydrolase n=1 Tax=Galbibacter mesophilus TaxID=379069 RepID=UPI002043B9C0|nr:nucleoside hydrolase [Galbibacter mesophilus]MCM5664335.1 nucleoside hydrolase [Galbibacter mesophilus]